MLDIEKGQLKEIESYARSVLETDQTGHGMDHIERVVRHARVLHESEGGDLFVILAGAYLHDVLDDKLIDNPVVAEKKLLDRLGKLGLSAITIAHIMAVIHHVSFSNELVHGQRVMSLEERIVQDADRLDALGAIGIARTFYYGGKKGHVMYDNQILPRKELTKEQYRTSETVINHFYEKLFLLQDKMKTQTGKQLAQLKTERMTAFVTAFIEEWEG